MIPAGEDMAALIGLSRLIGKSQDLVLYGGGNTSVKGAITNALGESVEALFIKASGIDMASAGPDDFVALNLSYLLRLRNLSTLSDEAMTDAFGTHLLKPATKMPSIETLLHAFIPPHFIVHTHPGVILALTNRKDGGQTAADALGHDVPVIPYLKAGFPLALAVADAFEANPGAKAMILMQHGLVTWGRTAQEAYEATIAGVGKAEKYVSKMRSRSTGAQHKGSANRMKEARSRYVQCAPILRGLLGTPSGNPDRPFDRVILSHCVDEEILHVLGSKKGKELALSAPLTPDYLIRTKAYPLWIDSLPNKDGPGLRETLAKAIANYGKDRIAYLKKHGRKKNTAANTVDNFPRVILIPGIGAIGAGPDSAAASLATVITRQALRMKMAIHESGGTYRGLPEADLFEMEFRAIQRAKLRQASPGSLAGTVALITGSAGAIGFGICEALLEQGTHIAMTDLAGEKLDAAAGELANAYPGRVLGVGLDVTDPLSVAEGFRTAIQAWGGIDLVIINAGIAHVSALDQMELEMFRKLERVNTEGTLLVLGETARHFKTQNTGGDIVLVSTKNVFAPGAKFGAYSATKAAAHQLARIASLELADIGVRVNMVAPDGVFSHGSKKSGLWTEVGPDRMRARGLDEKGLEEYYRQRNLLKTKVTAYHVAKAVLFFATRQTPTTGATLPVDGGLPDATPR